MPSTTRAVPALIVAVLLLAGCATQASPSTVGSLEEQCSALKRETDKIDANLNLALTTQDAVGRSTLIGKASDQVDDVAAVPLDGDLASARDAYVDSLGRAFRLMRVGTSGAQLSDALGDTSNAQVDLNSSCGWKN